MALMCFHAARFESRLDAEGQIILLENQDRTLWEFLLTRLALYFYFKASASGNEVSEYHIEAAIASYHANAPTFEATNWKAIYYCYNFLFRSSRRRLWLLTAPLPGAVRKDQKAGLEALLTWKA